MAEYINRDAALDIVNGWREQLIPTYGKNDEYVKCLETVAEHLETLPAADVVERKIGTWIFGATQGHSWMKCSECLVSQSGQTATFSFCPNCGAKMEVLIDV